MSRTVGHSHISRVLAEVGDRQGARKAGRAVGGSTVGAGDVVADRCRGEVAAEDGAGIVHVERKGLGVGDLEFQMLRSDGVDDGECRRLIVDDRHVAALGQGGADVVGPRGNGEQGVARCTDGVGNVGVGGHEPGEPIGAVLGLHQEVDGDLDPGSAVPSAITTTSEGPAKAAAMPTVPETSCFATATYTFPGPATTSTGAIDLGPVRHRSDRLGAPHGDAAESCRREHRGVTPPTSRFGGTHSTIEPTPATRAGTALMMTVDG